MTVEMISKDQVACILEVNANCIIYIMFKIIATFTM